MTLENQKTQIAESSKEPKQTSFLLRLFKYFLGIVAILIGIWLAFFLTIDRKMTRVPVAEAYADVDWSAGQVPDYRALWEERRAKAVEPVEKNGWTLVLRALGPKAFYFMEKRPEWLYLWNPPVDWAEECCEISRDREFQEWHSGYWKPICKFYGVDPEARPTMFDRLDLRSYLVKNGIRGDEEIIENPSDLVISPDGAYRFSSKESGYFEQGGIHPGRATYETVEKELQRLSAGPWRPSDSPTVARWLTENEENFTLIKDFVESDSIVLNEVDYRDKRFSMPPFLNDFGDSLQTYRNFMNALVLRANLRIGEGNISGALEDAEIMFRFAERLLGSEGTTFLERNVGVSFAWRASTLLFSGNPSAQPTSAERARLIALNRRYLDLAETERWFEKLDESLALFDFGAFAEIVSDFGRGSVVAGMRFELQPADYIEREEQKAPWKLLPLFPINEPKTFKYFREKYLECAQSEDPEAAAEEFQAKSVYQAYALKVLQNMVFERRQSVANYRSSLWQHRLAIIAHALWLYYDEHGTLPPAFTVDETGRPLHSWRALILPYLGEDEKALYEQIKFDEPWDSAHNQAFHNRIPEIYRPLDESVGDGETTYSVLLSSDGLFDASGIGKDPIAFLKREDRVGDAAAMVIERLKPCNWMDPNSELDLDATLASVAGESNADSTDNYAKSKALFATVFSRRSSPYGVLSANLGSGVILLAESCDDVELNYRLLGVPVPKTAEDESSSSDDATDVDSTEAE